MKKWYSNVEGVPCPGCSLVVIPEFSQGFFRIPVHDDATADAKWKIKCSAIGKKVIAD